MNAEYTPRRLVKQSPNNRQAEASLDKLSMPSIAKPLPEAKDSTGLSRNTKIHTQTNLRLSGMNADSTQLYKIRQQISPLRARDDKLGQSVQLGLDRALQQSKEMIRGRNKHNASQPLRQSSCD